MAAGLPSPQELDAMASVEPEIAGRLKDMAALFPAVEATGAVEIVQKLRQRFGTMPLSPKGADNDEYTATYETSDKTQLRLVVYRPANTTELLPLVVWYHGGGHCVGMPEQNASLLRDIALQQQCVVVAPEYRLAPEHKWPTGINDSWDALRHIASNAKTFGSDPALGFAIGGESAGASISSIMQVRARNEKLNPPLTGALLSAGSYFNPPDLPAEYKELYRSRNDQRCKDSPMLSEKSAKAFYECHAADWASHDYRTALDPLNHAGLPRTYIQVCGWDINRDDGILYNDLLKQRGVETRMSIYEGAPHCFWYLLSDSTMGRKWKEDTQAGISWLLHKA